MNVKRTPMIKHRSRQTDGQTDRLITQNQTDLHRQSGEDISIKSCVWEGGREGGMNNVVNKTPYAL